MSEKLIAKALRSLEDERLRAEAQIYRTVVPDVATGE